LVKTLVQQYHRGDPQSHAFASWVETVGSSVRKTMIGNVLNFVNEQADDILIGEVGKHVLAQAKVWLEPDNYQCA
jgi:hypothetical protein